MIGSNVIVNAGTAIYHQVTLGADRDGKYPVIEENVTVYAGAKIFGGIVVGKNAIVGANSVVIRDVGAGYVVAGSSARRIDQLNSQMAFAR